MFIKILRLCVFASLGYQHSFLNILVIRIENPYFRPMSPLPVETNLPPPFLERMSQRLGDELPAFLASSNVAPPVSIRLNPAKPIGFCEECEKVPWHPEGRYLPERPVFTLDPAFHAGAYYVQEASSMFLREVLAQTHGQGSNLRVLDLCAAPGGKTTLLASVLGDDSFLLANETIQTRVPALRTNIAKWGLPNIAVSNHDPADFGQLAGFFDVVVVDAPCSGEGLFRKDPAAVGEWSPQNLALCAGRQRRILDAAQTLMRPGGLLVYSTCTFNHGENEEIIEWLIGHHGFDPVPLQVSPAMGIVPAGTGGLSFYPHKVRGEGFFIACLRKNDLAAALSRIKSDGLNNWQLLGDKATLGFRDWLETPDELAFFQKPNGEVVALPRFLLPDCGLVGKVLHRRSFGTVIGEMKNRDFVPNHALALSCLVKNDLPAVELEMTDALRFLSKENLEPTGLPKGWVLARYKGLNLGWMKVLPNRVNNYLPNDWRIRMAVNG